MAANVPNAPQIQGVLPPKRKERAVKGTFTRPNASENIMCVSKVLSRLALLGDAGMSYSYQHLFKASFPPQPERTDPDHIAYSVSPQNTVTRPKRSATSSVSPSVSGSGTATRDDVGVGVLDTRKLDQERQRSSTQALTRPDAQQLEAISSAVHDWSMGASFLSDADRDRALKDSEKSQPLLSPMETRENGWWGTPFQSTKDWSTAFDIDLFLPRLFKVRMPTCSYVHPFTTFQQTQKKNKVPKPTVQTIFSFIKTVFDEAHLNPECCINALVLVERLLEQRTFMLNSKNWIPIVMTSLLISSKTCDDLSSWNVEFTEIFPIFPVAIVNTMEREFLTALSYNLFVSTAVYANYYYYLRALRDTPVPTRTAPKHLGAQYSMLRSGLRGPGKVGTPSEQFVLDTAHLGGGTKSNDSVIVSL